MLQEQIRRLRAVIERVSGNKPNTLVVQQLDELREISRRLKLAGSAKPDPVLAAKLIQVREA